MADTDASVVRGLLPFLRPYRGRLLLAAATAATGPVLLAVRIWLLKILIDNALKGHRPALIPLIAVAFIAIAVLRGLLNSCTQHTSGAVGTFLVRDLRTRVFTRLQGLSLRYFHAQPLGDLLTRLGVDIGAIEELLVSGLPTFAANVVTIVLFFALLVALDPVLVLVALAVLPALAVCTVVDARRGRSAQQDIRERTSELTVTAEERLSAIAVIKAFNRGPQESAHYAEVASRSAHARLRAVYLRATYPPLVEVIAGIGTAAVVWIGSTQVLAGHLSLGSLVVFLSYLAALYAPIQGLSKMAGTAQRAMVGAVRVSEILNAPAHFVESTGTRALPAGPGLLEGRHVSFGYDRAQQVLHISFRIEPGELVALVGASGAGKTTLVSLLLSYSQPDQGQILLDGHPLGSVGTDHAREKIAAVLQEPMLFNTTIGANIRYGKPDATDKQVRRAAVAAGVDEFTASLDDGYNTVVGPRGARLSGGQRQRVALARALLKDAPVLLLDEATSALDPTTEGRVLTALSQSTRHRAVLLVAHRYSTISHANRIIVLDRGRLAQDGPPEALAGQPGLFADLLAAQNQRPGRPAGASR